jgi:hypothetical protein
MRTLVWIGILLLAIWVVGWLVLRVTGFLIHLLALAGVIFLIWWVIQRFSGLGRTGTGPRT